PRSARRRDASGRLRRRCHGGSRRRCRSARSERRRRRSGDGAWSLPRRRLAQSGSPRPRARKSELLFVGPRGRRNASGVSPCRKISPVLFRPPHMSRRIPLPRLTRRQRSARWQRERRQQAVIVTVFSAVLFFVLGLVSWAASSKYYSDNLKSAMTFDGRAVAMRDWTKEKAYEL